VAAQLALCLDAVREARRAGDAGREERSTNLVRDCTQQAAQLGRLHGQARYEPVERALDQRRRARILALTLDLMDAVLSDRPDAAELLLARGGGRLRSLSDAIVREDEAILDSMQRARDTVRGEAAFRPSDLSAAHRALVERIEELRTQPEALRDLSDEDKQRIAIQLDSRRRLVFRQLAIEDWLADWRSAEGAADRGESQ
jgi:hypothetical protein